MNNHHFYLLSLSLSFHSAEDRILEKHHKLMGNEAAMKTFSLVLLANANNTNNKRLLKANFTSCMYSTMSNLHVCNQSQFFFLLKKTKQNLASAFLDWHSLLHSVPEKVFHCLCCKILGIHVMPHCVGQQKNAINFQLLFRAPPST